jgi:hypothetical protein
LCIGHLVAGLLWCWFGRDRFGGDRSRVTTYCNDDGVHDHHGEHSNQREEHADSIPSHVQLSVINRRAAFSLRRTAWRRRRGHDLILPGEDFRPGDLQHVAREENFDTSARLLAAAARKLINKPGGGV